ncbi:hypothetical protein GIB67_014518 [Kingdonia uniflora]|uniref:Uncharacterized protein n=1 Tax=Kingdonia uniflora TaxID=39325 RepID=A0A7J7NMG4_9MAGN|nr:hypothetical protein GIB67_014518 [Kingdonia uniflora]
MYIHEYVQIIITFGFLAFLDLFSNDLVSIDRTCNCVYLLVQQRQRDIELRESSNGERQRLIFFKHFNALN